MSHESNKALLNIETHTLPDDYPFSVDELDRIIAGEVVSPHQAAINISIKRKLFSGWFYLAGLHNASEIMNYTGRSRCD
ncbi:hypothetical protein [Klebsiella variicola]|uniref:hypothetical protein n=1 Tax=Klebsiella variicola TaxID=244366 RepID=UPI0021BF0EEC|nr:hypothetical protein [Klebsiella variicola]